MYNLTCLLSIIGTCPSNISNLTLWVNSYDFSPCLNNTPTPRETIRETLAHTHIHTLEATMEETHLQTMGETRHGTAMPTIPYTNIETQQQTIGDTLRETLRETIPYTHIPTPMHTLSYTIMPTPQPTPDAYILSSHDTYWCTSSLDNNLDIHIEGSSIFNYSVLYRGEEYLTNNEHVCEIFIGYNYTETKDVMSVYDNRSVPSDWCRDIYDTVKESYPSRDTRLSGYITNTVMGERMKSIVFSSDDESISEDRVCFPYSSDNSIRYEKECYWTEITDTVYSNVCPVGEDRYLTTMPIQGFAFHLETAKYYIGRGENDVLGVCVFFIGSDSVDYIENIILPNNDGWSKCDSEYETLKLQYPHRNTKKSGRYYIDVSWVEDHSSDNKIPLIGYIGNTSYDNIDHICMDSGVGSPETIYTSYRDNYLDINYSMGYPLFDSYSSEYRRWNISMEVIEREANVVRSNLSYSCIEAGASIFLEDPASTVNVDFILSNDMATLPTGYASFYFFFSYPNNATVDVVYGEMPITGPSQAQDIYNSIRDNFPGRDTARSGWKTIFTSGEQKIETVLFDKNGKSCYTNSPGTYIPLEYRPSNITQEMGYRYLEPPDWRIEYFMAQPLGNTEYSWWSVVGNYSYDFICKWNDTPEMSYNIQGLKTFLGDYMYTYKSRKYYKAINYYYREYIDCSIPEQDRVLCLNNPATTLSSLGYPVVVVDALETTGVHIWVPDQTGNGLDMLYDSSYSIPNLKEQYVSDYNTIPNYPNTTSWYDYNITYNIDPIPSILPVPTPMPTIQPSQTYMPTQTIQPTPVMTIQQTIEETSIPTPLLTHNPTVIYTHMPTHMPTPISTPAPTPEPLPLNYYYGQNEMSITTSGDYDPTNYPPRSVLLEDDTEWKSTEIENPWIKFEFHNHKVLLQSFDIGSWNGPRSFTVEGSDDDSTWTTLHSMNNPSDFVQGQYTKKHYECTSTSQSYKYIKLTQGDDGSVWIGHFHLSLAFIGFYGSLTPNPTPIPSPIPTPNYTPMPTPQPYCMYDTATNNKLYMSREDKKVYYSADGGTTISLYSDMFDPVVRRVEGGSEPDIVEYNNVSEIDLLQHPPRNDDTTRGKGMLIITPQLKWIILESPIYNGVNDNSNNPNLLMNGESFIFKMTNMYYSQYYGLLGCIPYDANPGTGKFVEIGDWRMYGQNGESDRTNTAEFNTINGNCVGARNMNFQIWATELEDNTQHTVIKYINFDKTYTNHSNPYTVSDTQTSNSIAKLKYVFTKTSKCYNSYGNEVECDPPYGNSRAHKCYNSNNEQVICDAYNNLYMCYDKDGFTTSCPGAIPFMCSTIDGDPIDCIAASSWDYCMGVYGIIPCDPDDRTYYIEPYTITFQEAKLTILPEC